VTVEGAAIAAATGAVAGLGYALLEDRDLRRSIKTSIGLGLVVLGSYLFSPAGLRRMWLGDYSHLD